VSNWPLPEPCEKTLLTVIRNCSSPVTSKRQRTIPRWSAVSKVTGHGSGYSAELCRWAGLDPDEMVRPR
jgi:hypothetical protein